jgi:hypothetical protein
VKNLAEKNFIGEYYIDPKLCDRLIRLHKRTNRTGSDKNNPTPWLTKHEGRVAGGLYPNSKKSIDVCIDPVIFYNPKVAGPSYKREIKVVNDYYLALNSCLNKYGSELAQCSYDKKYDGGQEVCGSFHITERINIQHYKPGEGFFVWHHERANVTMHRELVFMTYLNDVPDGGTEFLHQKLTTTAKKGKTLIWPAGYTHVHKGQISHTQEKYIATGWLGHHERRQEDQ